ncbi:MAG: hypothetical protein Phyf2KO_11010 [Phycisphaerales bacterium]
MDSGKKKQAVQIGLFGLVVILAGIYVVKMVTGAEPGSAASLTQDVTIRCSETGNEWTISRGRLEQALYTRPGMLDPDEGLVNSETGKATGFPKSRKRDWDDVIARINAEKQAIMEKNRR